MEQAQTFDYIAYTDGGCARNPGGRGGYGVILIETATGKQEEYSSGYISTTNNRMEMMAALVALSRIPRGRTVHLYSDSQLLINCMTGLWAKKKNKDLWDAIERELQGRSVTLSWVKGHNGDPMNERCDKLATEAMAGPVLLPDIGYVPEISAEKPTPPVKKENTAEKIVPLIPKELNIPYGNPANISVHEECRRSIAGLTEECGFHKLASVKTGGTDGWSRIRMNQIPELFDAEVIRFVRKYFPDDIYFMDCMRWYGRGMSLSLAIRKTQADEKISEQMMRKNTGR